jgi:hypothetical protein
LYFVEKVHGHTSVFRWWNGAVGSEGAKPQPGPTLYPSNTEPVSFKDAESAENANHAPTALVDE